MDIKTRKEGDHYKVTATEGKGRNRVVVQACYPTRKEACSTAIHGCFELARELRELEDINE